MPVIDHVGYDAMVHIAEEALLSALNGDTRALMSLPREGQLLIIQASVPRRPCSRMCRVGVTVRDNDREAYVYVITAREEIDQLTGALGATFAVFQHQEMTA